MPFLRRFAGTGATAAAFATGRAARREGRSCALDPQRHEGRSCCSSWSPAATPPTSTTPLAPFAADVIARHLRAEAVERADWHRTQGHRLVIVSASLAVYLRPIAEHLRFDAVLATELEVGDDGRLTGAIDGANVRGAEKARRLDAWLARELPAPTRSCGPTATAPATRSCGHAPTAPSASVATRTTARAEQPAAIHAASVIARR